MKRTRQVEHCESCGQGADQDVHILTVVLAGDARYRVCTRCADVAVPLQLPFEEER